MRARVRRCIFDAAAEELAANVELAAGTQHLADGLAFEARAVDRPFARDHEVCAGCLRSEVDALQDDARARDQLSPDRRERSAQAARGPGAGQLRVGPKRFHRPEPGLELLDLLRRGALLRAER